MNNPSVQATQVQKTYPPENSLLIGSAWKKLTKIGEITEYRIDQSKILSHINDKCRFVLFANKNKRTTINPRTNQPFKDPDFYVTLYWPMNAEEIAQAKQVTAPTPTPTPTTEDPR